MKIVKLKGGLGNQMFQYTFAKLLEKKTREEIMIDMSYFGDTINDPIRKPRIQKFSLTLKSPSEEQNQQVLKLTHSGDPLSWKYRLKVMAESLINKEYCYEKDRAYINPSDILNKTYFDGYWQSWRYVDDVKDELKSEFVPKNEVSKKTLETMKRVSDESAVFVGVRRGDYSQEEDHYGSFGIKYYLKAMDTIEKEVSNPVYYIFSNDINWCKVNLDFGNRKVIYREKEDQVDDFEELLVMSSCKHAIIINSTYHWWGAELINNPYKIVVAPKRWFFDEKPIDIVRPEWIK